MRAKSVVPREQARRDIEAAIDYYADHAGEAVALRFVEALESALRMVGTRAATGSPQYGRELEIRGLRHRRLKRFPFLLLYIERADHIDLWRLLHAQRDIPTLMRVPDA